MVDEINVVGEGCGVEKDVAVNDVIVDMVGDAVSKVEAMAAPSVDPSVVIPMVKVDAFGPGGVLLNSYEVEARAVTKLKNRVCIVGCADSKKMVPWGEPDMEFWGVNNLYGVELPGAHYDRWFEIHNIELGADGKYRRREGLDFRGQDVKTYLEGIAAFPCPLVYMQKKWDIIPQSVEYPLDLVTTVFGRYITNTISYEIALAILMDYKEIHIYGVDMAVGTEWASQRPSCEYFVGYATGKGIKVYIPDEADLLKTRFLYGFEEQKQTAWSNKLKIVKKDMSKKMNQSAEQMKAAENAYNQYVGAIHAIGEMDKIWDSVR